MQLKIINSNSNGNAYLLHNNQEALLVECGVRFDLIKKALNFNLKKVVGALVSHSHGDHSKSMKEVLNAGIDVYSGIETFKAKGLEGHHRAHFIEAEKPQAIGDFLIKPFEVNHDVPCFGFMIKHPEMGTTVFVTDTFYSDYIFRGVNHFIVECNHETEIIEHNNTPSFLRDRIVRSHMNLDTCKELLQANDLSQVMDITLIHLSDSNSDSRRFKKEVEEQTGKIVYIAEAGMELDFNKEAI